MRFQCGRYEELSWYNLIFSRRIADYHHSLYVRVCVWPPTCASSALGQSLSFWSSVCLIAFVKLRAPNPLPINVLSLVVYLCLVSNCDSVVVCRGLTRTDIFTCALCSSIAKIAPPYYTNDTFRAKHNHLASLRVSSMLISIQTTYCALSLWNLFDIDYCVTVWVWFVFAYEVDTPSMMMASMANPLAIGSSPASGGTSAAVANTVVDTHAKWLMTHEQIQNSPSRRDGIPAEQELSLRQKAAHLIQDMGQRLRV